MVQVGVTYNLTITNTADATEEPQYAAVAIDYCNGLSVSSNVKVQRSCLPIGVEYHISWAAQYVNVPSECCLQDAEDDDYSVSGVSLLGFNATTSYVRVFVPQNDTTSTRYFHVRIYYCDGESEVVTIIQDGANVEWREDGWTCQGKDKYKVERKFEGDGIVMSATTETRVGELIEANSSACTETYSRWTVSGTMCYNGSLWEREVEELSTDGVTWIPNGNTRPNKWIAYGSGCTTCEVYIDSHELNYPMLDSGDTANVYLYGDSGILYEVIDASGCTVVPNSGTTNGSGTPITLVVTNNLIPRS